MIKLFLLNPSFNDKKLSSKQKYYCPHCAVIEGVLKYYPELKKFIEVIYVNFEKPRQEIINLIGKENQNCPSLVIHKNELSNSKLNLNNFKTYEDYLFIDSPLLITEYLSFKYNIGMAHP